MPFDTLMSSVGLLVASIFVGSNGGRFAIHREIDTRLLRVRGAPALAIGLAMVAAGLVGAGFALYFGLRLGE